MKRGAKRGTRVLAIAAGLTIVVGMTSSPAPAEPPQHTPLKALCKSFLKKGHAALPHGAKITSRTIQRPVAEGSEFCSVQGTITTSAASTITWEVELPHPRTWNGKTLTVGGGAFDGFIPTEGGYHDMIGPSADPFVKISSDSGHQVRTFYPWAMDDDALKNHGYEANHISLEIGTFLAAEFYNKSPQQRYMIGQSNGGRSGLVAAQRYPGDYDGIVAMEPAISQQSHEAFLPQTLKHIFASPDNWMSADDIAIFSEAETAACDGLDGLEDGVIGNIEACDYTGQDLLCPEGVTDACLTGGQIESIRLIYTDDPGSFTMEDGLSAGYPRFGRGGAATSDWVSYIFGRTFEGRNSFNYRVDEEAARVVSGNPDVDLRTFDPTPYAEQYRRLSSRLDPTDHDLTAFAKSGGKLLIWYGTADACVSLYRTAEYFESLKDQMGIERVREFARMLATPSVGHKIDGPGAGAIDLVAAIDAWVEDSEAPDNLVGTKYDESGKPLFTRPVCQWPAYPRYDGEGDPTKAESFDCVLPS